MDAVDTSLEFLPVDDGFRGPQITKFQADVLDVVSEKDEKYDRNVIRIVYDNLTGITTRDGETYEFPVFDIVIGVPKLNQRGTISQTNAYAILYSSAKKVIPTLANWKALKGYRLDMEYTDGHKLYNKDRGGEYEGKSWEVVGLVGSAGVAATSERSADDIALSILEGKTKQKFQVEALKEPTVRAKMSSVIVSGKWLKELEDSGKVTKDSEGIYSVVK